jgi:hypothetical protein
MKEKKMSKRTMELLKKREESKWKLIAYYDKVTNDHDKILKGQKGESHGYCYGSTRERMMLYDLVCAITDIEFRMYLLKKKNRKLSHRSKHYKRIVSQLDQARLLTDELSSRIPFFRDLELEKEKEEEEKKKAVQ